MKALRKIVPPPEGAGAERDLAYGVAQAVQNARMGRGLTQGQLAEMTGTTQPRISKLESATELPNLRTLLKIAEALGMRVHVNLTEHAPGDET